MAVLFSLLYLAVGFVSVYHAISFFSIANMPWLATILAIAFEVGQAAILTFCIATKSRKVMPWVLMGTLTLVQVIGNIFSSYQYMVINSPHEIQYFTDSVLFFVKDPDPQVNNVIISYIVGAILPVIALCMTSLVVDASEVENTAEGDDKPESPAPKVVELPKKEDNKSEYESKLFL